MAAGFPDAPINTDAVVERWRTARDVGPNITHVERIGARPAATAEWPDWLNTRLRAALLARGIERPYTHQRRALDMVHAGRNAVVVTPTASGKTLCYNAPVLDAVLRDGEARAL